ncbi:hypothetical protein [Catalinimonas niigatensis]|uniref:hypothetical protein n=1 Tax=Catalinimonas niigatensis TaxID=1397264 RepID=UPI002666346C|nr:hypothetical protein [Catalinimonas niigatensis]WPP52983.1 hypothetical protein PZB72_11415 [Catalinimonas niigatensis]
MKKLTDEEIQKLLETQDQDLAYMDSSDAKMYQLLFEALKEEPSEGLSMSFANQVVREALNTDVQRQVRRYWLFTFVSIFVAVCVSVFFLLFYQQPAAKIFFEWILQVRWIILFGLFMFALIQLADYRLVNRKQVDIE